MPADPKPPSSPPRRRRLFDVFFIAVAILAAMVWLRRPPTPEFAYGELLQLVADGKVQSVAAE
jgi:hypothetical protein